MIDSRKSYKARIIFWLQGSDFERQARVCFLQQRPGIETRKRKKESLTMKTIRLLFIVMLGIAAALPARSQAQESKSFGAVFAMTNAADRNQIIAYKRSADGSLAEGQSFPTGGRGSGGTTDPLGSQGSLTLTQDHSILLAVNAGSGDISVFRVHGANLSLVDRVPCGASEPVAVAQHGNLVYVVNAGGTSNVTGFRLDRTGRLRPIPDSIAFLSTGNSGAASLSFSPDGQFLLVTEKLTNKIDAFHIQIDGTLGPIVVNPSVGPGAFAVLFAPNGAALVSETGPAGEHNAAAISSYAVQANGMLSPISASAPTLGAATCWQEVTPDGRFVYTSNSGSATISGFSIGANGVLTPLSVTVVATLPSGSINLDIAISADGKFLYTLNSGTGTINIFEINQDGTLTSLGDIGGLSSTAGMNGIAAI
jgi:6-phosphogluconolactonase (cycloisomerase 2 family)